MDDWIYIAKKAIFARDLCLHVVEIIIDQRINESWIWIENERFDHQFISNEFETGFIRNIINMYRSDSERERKQQINSATQ